MDHKKLDIWNLSMEFAIDLYKITEQIPNSERFDTYKKENNKFNKNIIN